MLDLLLEAAVPREPWHRDFRALVLERVECQGLVAQALACPGPLHLSAAARHPHGARPPRLERGSARQVERNGRK